MTMRITITEACRSENGLSILTVGQTVTVQRAFGAQLVQQQRATNTDGVVIFPSRGLAMRGAPITPGASTLGLVVGTQLINPATGLVYGQADGAGGFSSLGGAGIVPVLNPPGFRWTDHGLTLRRRADGVIVTDWLATDNIPAPTNIWYVDPVGGNDATGAVNNPLLPVKSLSVALAKVEASPYQIQIINLTADFIAAGSFGWNNTQPTNDFSVLNRTGFRFISAQGTRPTWVQNGTFPVVYQVTIAASSAAGVTDVSVSSAVTYTDANGALQTATNLPRRFRTLRRVASIAAVAATPGTSFHDGTVLYVQAHDSRDLIGSQTMCMTNLVNNGRFPIAAADRIGYAENIDFVGGAIGFLMQPTASATRGLRMTLSGCSFQGAGSSNGFTIRAGSSFSSLYRCGAYDNNFDGFNYTGTFVIDSTTGVLNSPSCLEYECLAIGNGTTGSTNSSDNASTAHEFTNIIRLGCVYVDSDDAALVDIDSVHAWCMNVHAGAALTAAAGRQNFKFTGSVRAWLDTCFAPEGASPRWFSESAETVLSHYNSGVVVNSVGALGKVRPYLG